MYKKEPWAHGMKYTGEQIKVTDINLRSVQIHYYCTGVS